MSTNRIDIEAVNARAREEVEMTIELCDKCIQITKHDSKGNCLKCPQTPMTKIPSVELRAKVLHVRLLQRDGLTTEKIKEALTADRTTLLTELRKWLAQNVADTEDQETIKAHLDELIKEITK